ncbi:MAG: right-handed parallel beta-helix repeat-containing protein, partial [Burkholderiales bacterium]|nr:right-handed parallel beta-helix repeat-containing protein [Opitutaceae bacterium]
RLVGARPVDSARLRPLADPALLARLAPEARPHVREVDLSGLDLRNAGRLPDYARDTADLFAVFLDGKRLPLSRWPNGEYGYTTMKRVVSSGSFRARTTDGGTFEYREDRPARWQTALAENGVWLRGFWRVPWVAETLRVKSIDPKAKTMTFAVSTANGIGSKYSRLEGNTRVGDGKEGWFALNLLEEIDQPGEWSVDFSRSKLYIWLPAGAPGSRLFLADNAEPLVSLSGAKHVSFRDLVFTHQMGEGVSITDGDSVRLLGCRVENILRRGVLIRGGFNHVVQSCDLTEIGLAAIDLLGGDRSTLAPSKHQIVNNHIWRAALLAPVPALVAGLDVKTQQLVGARIAHNRIHDVTYSGVHFAGNDNVLENNELYRLGLDGGDLGGFYTTGGWTARGNIVRKNFIHHSENANAIYMDDGHSGLLAEDNLIYRVESGLFVGGGHDHVLRRNLIIQTHRAIHVDDRGVARKYVADDKRLRSDLDSVPYQESPWREKYPALARILDQRTDIPRDNLISENIAVGCETLARRSGNEDTLGGFRFKNNTEHPSTDIFTDAASLDFTLRAPAAAPALAGLPVLDLSRYGLQLDEYRRVVPPRDLALLRAGDTKRKAFDSQQDVNAY